MNNPGITVTYPRSHVLLYPLNCTDFLDDGFIEDALDEYRLKLELIKRNVKPFDYCQPMEEDMYDKLIIGWQHTIVISHALDKYPIVGTYGLNSCVSLILYEPNYKIGVVTHFDGLPGWSQATHQRRGYKLEFDPLKYNIGNALAHVYKIIGDNTYSSKLEFDVYIVGGIYRMSEVTIVDIYELITKKFENVVFNIKGRNLLGHDNQKRNVAIDTRTGELYRFINRIIKKKTGKNPNMQELDLTKEDGFRLRIMYLPKSFKEIFRQNRNGAIIR
jgi:chemotaxis receptor (MCP) glutamine deamidase CheD